MIRARTRAPVELTAPYVRSTHGALEVETAVVEAPLCPPRLSWTGHSLQVVAAVAAALGLSGAALRSQTRVRRVTAARRMALLVWTGELERPGIEMAQTLGTSASAACGLLARATLDERVRAAELACLLRAHVR